MPRVRTEPLAFFLTLIAALLLLLHQFNLLQPFENIVIAFFSPLQDGLSEALSDVNSAFGGFRDAQEWRKKYEERQAIVDELLVENARLREKEKENGELRELLGFRLANPTYRYQAADVIGRDPNPLVRYVIIDRGSIDGLAKNMPVISARGLVGQISEVNLRSAKAMLITDLASSVNAISQETRATGIVQGDLSGALLMRFIQQNEKIEKGNIILTSGLGGRFPKRLVIGQVQAIKARDVDMFQTVELRPSVDFNTLEVVQVILNFTTGE
jgi:rod shape-determining protein MreC